MKTVLILMQKEFSLLFRDKTSITLTFLVPFLLIYIFGNIFSGDGKANTSISKIKIAVVNNSDHITAKMLVDGLGEETGFELVPYAESVTGEHVPMDENKIRKGIAGHDYDFGIVIPKNFLKKEALGIRLKFISNPINPIETQIVLGLLQKVVYEKLPLLLSIQLDKLQKDTQKKESYIVLMDSLSSYIKLFLRNAESAEPFQLTTMTEVVNYIDSWQGVNSPEKLSASRKYFKGILEIEEDQVFGENLQNPQLARMIGGYAIMFLLFATTASAASLFVEKNDGMFVRLLSMPVKRTDILWSKYLFNMVLGVLQTTSLFVAASFLFDLQLFEHILNLFVVSVFSAGLCTSFGMLLASVSKTPQQAQGFGTLLILSMTSISGAWIPLSMMNEIMQVIGKLTPIYWCVEAYSGVLLEGKELIQLLPHLGTILLFTLALNLVSIYRFRQGQLFQ